MATLHKTLCSVAQYMQKRRKPSQILTGFTPFRYTLSIYFITPHRKMQVFFTKNVTAKPSGGLYLGQYRTKIVRQMRRQIFRQMKQKAE
jgi:hypothetical protein